MNKRRWMRWAMVVVGVAVAGWYAVAAARVYAAEPAVPSHAVQVEAEGASGAARVDVAAETARAQWNNRFAKKAFFALVGMFVALLGVLPKKRLWIAKLLFSGGLVVLILHHVMGDGKIEALWARGIQISAWWLAAAFAVKATGMGCTVARWHVLLRGQGFRIPLRHLIASFLIGRFIGSFAPGTSGLDGYRAYDIARYTGHVARSIAVIFVEKITGFFVLGTLLLAAIPLGGALFASKNVNTATLWIMAAGFVGMMALSFVVLFQPRVVRWIAHRFVPSTSPLRAKVDKAVAAVAAYEGKRSALLLATAIGFGVHLCTIGMYFCTSRALFSAPGNAELFVTATLMIGATVLPLSIAGIGMREGVFVFFLGPMAALYAFAGYLVGEVISLLGGPVWLARRSDFYEVVAAQRAAVNADVREEETPRPADAAESAAAADAERDAAQKGTWGQVAAAGAVGGLWAGLAVAVLDAVRLWVIARHVDWTIPGYAVLLYAPSLSLLGAAAAVKLRWLGRWLGRPHPPRIAISTLTGGLLWVVGAFPIAAFYLHRDVFSERVGPGLLLSLVGALAAVAAAAVGVGWLLRRLFARPAGWRAKNWLGAAVWCAAAAPLWVAWALAPGGGMHAAAMAPPPSRTMPNVLVVMNDTHRADYAGPYGNTENLTPNLDAFAADGVVFNGFANASWTRPSVTTILTGRYPSSHTAIHKGSLLPDDVTTLAEVLQQQGFETIGVVTNYNLAPFFNVHQGFVDYQYLTPNLPLGASDAQSKLVFIEVVKKLQARFAGDQERPEDYYVVGETVTDVVLERLARRDKKRPFFAFVSYMDVHDPYFAHPYDGTAISHRAHPNPDPEDTAFIERMKALYKGEIRYWDRHFGRLIEGLKQQGLYDDTLIFVVSDHGEEFGEHGGFWHGTTLYDEQLRVLFIVKYPQSSPLAQAKGQRVDSWHSLVDVAPMILGELGIPIPEEMQGKATHSHARDTVFSEEEHQGNVLSAVRFVHGDRQLKYIEANPGNPRGLPEQELFDVERDAGEHRSLVGQSALFEQAKTVLRSMAAAASSGRAKAAQGDLSDEMKKQLDALGYMDDDK